MARIVRANLPIQLEGSFNTRELGGYPTKDGGNTASGQFLRSDKPTCFTDADKARLYDYGVRLVVDFRSDAETEREPCVLKGYKDIEYLNPPLLDNIHSNVDGTNPLPGVLSDLYIDLLDNKKDRFLSVFKKILEGHMDSCVLFNCTAGKDRTGTFAMLILKLAGVRDCDIVTDYAASGDNLRPEMDKMLAAAAAAGRSVPEGFLDMLRSRPVHMEAALAHLNQTCGTIENWFVQAGLSGDEIERLRRKILGSF